MISERIDIHNKQRMNKHKKEKIHFITVNIERGNKFYINYIEEDIIEREYSYILLVLYVSVRVSLIIGFK